MRRGELHLDWIFRPTASEWGSPGSASSASPPAAARTATRAASSSGEASPRTRRKRGPVDASGC